MASRYASSSAGGLKRGSHAQWHTNASSAADAQNRPIAAVGNGGTRLVQSEYDDQISAEISAKTYPIAKEPPCILGPTSNAAPANPISAPPTWRARKR